MKLVLVSAKIRYVCHFAILTFSVLLAACGDKEPSSYRDAGEAPDIFPDYADVTIPPNIAPLRFMLNNPGGGRAVAVLQCEGGRLVCEADKEGQFLFPEKKWRRLAKAAKGKSIDVTVYAGNGKEWLRYKPFSIHVSTDSIDSHIVYRLIQPGYVLWNGLGIYQRNLGNFEQKAILRNTRLDFNCMNCHSFNQRDPEKMVMHMRAKWGGTYVFDNGRIEKIDGRVSDRIQSLVYPYWHPSGRYIAFSSNVTRQAFHLNDPNRIEVYDLASDVVVYDVERHEVLVDSAICSSKSFETFPAFSPDGRTLYFCSAGTRTMPKDFKKVRYSLCAVSFDEKTGRFGTRVDTLFNSRTEGKSASFPRVSPDGRYLVFTAASYGNFSIWHKDADLYLIDLRSRQCRPLAQANSGDVESYHSWSGNSRWLVFSSRRMDGLYTRPFIARIGRDGQASKPFAVPQETPAFFSECMYSFNIPELVSGGVGFSTQKIVDAAHGEAAPLRLRGKGSPLR